MSRSADITLEWPDKERTYRLGIKELRKLQEALDAGPMQVFIRLSDQSWRVDDILEVIRIGALGGGATIDEARTILTQWVEMRPVAESLPYAQAILAAALHGVPDDPIEEGGGATKGKQETETDASASRASTRTGRSSGGRRARSTS